MVRPPLLRVALLAAAVGLLWVAPFARAEDAGSRRRTLERVLLEGRDFRSRVQAAFALGRLGDRAARPALERALRRDRNPAVRAAAATTLGKLGDPAARRALRRAGRDRSSAVRIQAAQALQRLERAAAPRGPQRGPGGARPSFSLAPTEGRIDWRRVRYVLTVGPMRSTARRFGHLAEPFAREAARLASLYRGILVYPADHPIPAAARRQIQRRNLPWLRLEGTVAEVRPRRQGRDLAVRVAVRLLLVEEPGRAIRGQISGAATASGPWDRSRRARRARTERLAQQALQAAVQGAMRKLPRGLSQLLARR